MSLAIGKKLTAGQRLQKTTMDIMGMDEFIALSGVLMIGKKSVVDGLPTACTNGKDEMYGKDFVESLNDPELRFLMLHECYHKMYRHLTTWEHLHKDNAQLANMAMDYVINVKLFDTDANRHGWIKMPECGLLDERYRGMDVAQVYKKLKQDPPPSGGGGGQGAIIVNQTNVTASYIIASGTNGFSVGPITVNSGVAVTVSSGQRWVVI